MSDDTVTTRSGSIHLREDGILCFRALPGVEQDEQEALHNLEASRQLAGGRCVPVLVDMREIAPMTRGARVAYARAEFASAQALVVGSPFTRIVANLFLKVGRPERPARMFTSEQEAIRWLLKTAA